MEKKHKIPRIVAIILLLTTGINASFAGLSFICRPDGTIMGLSENALRFSPFLNFLIPGIILLIFNGISNIVVAILTMHRSRYYSLLISFQGIVLVVWLVMQIYYLHEINALQLSMLLVGLLLILIGILINSEQSLKF